MQELVLQEGVVEVEVLPVSFKLFTAQGKAEIWIFLPAERFCIQGRV